jgi:N-acyl-D-aspartate/D-glutamate deacylase
VEFQWKAPFPFESSPIFQPVSAADFEGRKRIYADPAFRTSFRARSQEGVFSTRFGDLVIADVPGQPQLAERKLADVARERGVDPVDLAFDLGLATNLEARFRMPIANSDESEVAALLQHPGTVLGLSDAGAHASQLCDACAPTHLLGHWVREKGVLTLEEGVRMLTSSTADHFGIRERGRLAPGKIADVAVFDPETVAAGPLRRVRDFPAGADLLVADTSGIRFVIVNGTVIREDDLNALHAGDALPGRVLRGGQA